MDTQPLSQYVASRLRANLPKTELREELLALGWTEDEIEASYREAVISLGAPMPTATNRPTLTKKAGAVDVVINFFSFVLLGIVATALGTLYFQIVNHFFPDQLDATNWYSASAQADSIHSATAALLIGFPIYCLALRWWFGKFREDEGRVESKLSKWLTYLVLLAAALTMVGDAIAIVYTFLQGEITSRFFLKAFIILALAGGIFGFYFLERRKIQYHIPLSRSVFQRFGLGAALVVFVGIVLGFAASGSPLSERARNFDESRSSQLASLASCIDQYSLELGRLPETLAELRQSSQYNYCWTYFNDPETAVPFEYRVVTPTKATGAIVVGEYELCGTFTLDTSALSPASSGMGGVWDMHGTGRNCHTLQARLSQPSIAPPSNGVR